jgi:hypothetical protein
MFQILVKAFRDRNGVAVLASVERLSCSHTGVHVARLEQKGSNFFEINPLLISVSSSLTGSTHQR